MWGQILNGYLKHYMNNVPSWINGMDGMDVGQWMQYVMPMMGSSNPNEGGKRDFNRAPNHVRHGSRNHHYNNAKHRHRGGFNFPGMQNDMPWERFPWDSLPK